MLSFILMTVVSTSFHLSVGYTIDVHNDYYDYDYIHNDTTQSPILEYNYNDTLLESLLDSPYFYIRDGKNWRYSISEDTDTDNNGIISDDEKMQKIKNGMDIVFRILDKNDDGVVNKEEVSSPTLDIDNAKELASFYFDISPDRYYWTYYDLMQMNWVDQDKDGFLTVEEIENAVRFINTDEQKKILKELFSYFDENNDNKLSMDDLKPKLKQAVEILFKMYDQNNDGFISLQDMDFRIQWDDITSILALIKHEFMQDGEIDLNRLLVPFELDLNGDGIMNNFDLYLSSDHYYGRYSDFISIIAKVLKLLDQDQDGIYTFDEVRNFVVTVWTILDANHDMNISLEDGYVLLKNEFNVDSDKVSVLEGYVKYVQSFMKQESSRLSDYFLQAIDRNDDDEISLQEFFDMPEMCFSRWRGESCYISQRFPEPPETLEGDEFFPQSKYFRIRSYRQWEQRLMSFAFYSLDSPRFYNVKEFDWSGAAEIEEKIDALAPKGEALLNELRHKISAYKQVMSYLNDKE